MGSLLPLIVAATLLPIAVAQQQQFDCTVLDDGVYGEDCSLSVTVCLNGEALPSTCPSGELFNSAFSRCLQFESELQCTQGLWTLPRAVSSCPDIGNHYIASGFCSPQYEFCLNGETQTLFCPGIQVFDNVMQTCELKPSECMRREEFRAAEDDIELVCATKDSDGFYALDCSSHFIACSGGQAIPMQCPADLVYDEKRMKCEYPGNVAVCGGVEPEEGSGDIDGSGSEGSGEVEGSGEGSGIEEGYETKCENHEDGFYQLGECEEKFLGCSGGFAYIMNCPANLKYDEDAQQCDYPGSVAGCNAEGSGEDDVEASGEGSGDGSREGSGEESGSGSGESGSGSGEGSGFVDGSGEGSGEGSGVVLFDDDVTEHETVRDTVVTESNGDEIIDEEDTVEDTVEEEETLTGDGYSVEDEEEVTVEETKDEVKQHHHNHGHGHWHGHGRKFKGRHDHTIPSTDRTRKPVSSTTASTTIANESSASTTPSTTIPPTTTVSDTTAPATVASKSSNDTVPEVDGIPESGVSDSWSSVNVPINDKNVKESAPMNDAGEVASCADRADGFYAVGCSSDMISCSNGLLTMMKCPADLIFDEKNQICDYRANIPDCSSEALDEDVLLTPEQKDVPSGEVKETPQPKDETPVIEDQKKSGYNYNRVPEEKIGQNIVTKDDVHESVVAEVPSATSAPLPRPVVNKNVNEASLQYDDVDGVASCTDRRDGFYAVGCSSDMISCSSGVVTMMKCPADLVFDEKNQICDYPVHVAGCKSRSDLLDEDDLLVQDSNDVPRADVEQPEPLVAATVVPTTPEGPYAARDFTKRDPECRLDDGFFSIGCTETFVACKKGVAIRVQCGEGEAFDESAQSCVPLARHSTCYEFAVRQNYGVDDDVNMTKDEDEQSDLEKPVDVSFACSTEGASAESECSDWFTLCENGRGLTLYCMQGYLFDAQAARCVPAGHLEHCLAH